MGGSGPVPPAGHPATGWTPRDDLTRIAAAADACRACDLWARATQAVFGEGPRRAWILLVGEQPGDREDLVGQPFVGPAGAMLDKALAEAGIDRAQVYVTNAVKHFKWKSSGRRRLHDKPNAREVRACRPWLDLELGAVSPRVIVPLGATAATALLGSSFRITEQRGEVLRPDAAGPAHVASFHPSAILRAPDVDSRESMYRALVDDLRAAMRIAEDDGPRASAARRRSSGWRSRSDAAAVSDRSGPRSGSAPRAPRGDRPSDPAAEAGR